MYNLQEMQRSKAGKVSMEPQFYVTRESQQSKVSPARKNSYIGIRDLSDLDKIEEKDIVSHRGTIRGIKNRVRAGLANFENPAAIRKKSQESGKVIIYITSFRGVRSTYEECKYVLSVFHNLRVRVEERDVYVHKFYYNELMERLQRRSTAVPQVFISGQHIGGAEDLESLNESGELRRLLADFPRFETINNCKMCAGYRFIPCNKCGGSKNSLANNFTMEFRALRCTHCNDNGLEPCPQCTLKEEEEKKAIENDEEHVKTAKEPGKTRGDIVKMDSEKKKKDEQVKGGEGGAQHGEELKTDKQEEEQEEGGRDQVMMDRDEEQGTNKEEENGVGQVKTDREEEGEQGMNKEEVNGVGQVKTDREEEGEQGMNKEENGVGQVKMDKEEEGEQGMNKEEENGVGQVKTDREEEGKQGMNKAENGTGQLKLVREENGNQGTMYKEEEEVGDQVKANKEEEREDRWETDKEEEEDGGDQGTTYIGEEEDQWKLDREENGRDQWTAYIEEKEEGETK